MARNRHIAWLCLLSCIGALLLVGCTTQQQSTPKSTKGDSVELLMTTSAQATTRPAIPSTVFEWNQIAVEQTQVGQRRQFFRSRTGTLDELALHVTTLNPGQAPHAPHQHPDEEMIILKEGTLETTVNGQTKTMGPGSVLIIAPNDMHGWKNVGQTPATYYVLRWLSPGMKP